jgi:hypothetical protein
MNNYVLNKTNVLLGGQMKWNLSLSSIGSKMYVNDFYLSPISESIYFDRPDREELNYTHQENIKDLYDNITSDFFNYSKDNTILKYPLILNDNEKKDTYCNIYDACARRIKRSIYNDSISILCPIWLEDFGVGDCLCFDLDAYIVDGDGNRSIVVNKSLDLQESNKIYHDKFVKYFNEYIDSIIINKENDDSNPNANKIGDNIININFKNNSAQVEGIDVRTGEVVIKNTSNQLPNLLSRLRPKMDTDSIILNMLSNNKLICKQLFNFNLLFDFEDIFSPTILSQLRGAQIYFDVRVYVKKINSDNSQLETQLEKKSFYYDYSKDFKNNNKICLQEFEDYNYIDTIDKNKLIPNIIHWSLCENNDYIFNIYPNMYNETNLWTDNVELYPGCIDWCNYTILEETISNMDYYIFQHVTFADFSEFSYKNNIVNSVKYNVKLGKDGKPKKSLYLHMIVVDDNTNFNIYKDKDDGWVSPFYIKQFVANDNYICIVVHKRDIKSIAFKNFFEEKNLNRVTKQISSILSEYFIEEGKKYTDEYYTPADFKEHEDSKILFINKSIRKRLSNSPSDESNEVEYSKCDIAGFYLFRYDGKIKPTFVDFDVDKIGKLHNNGEKMDLNKYFEIRKITQSEYFDNWGDFVKTKYLPLYPSLNYFYLNEITSNNNRIENIWFDKSNLITLHKALEFEKYNIPIDEQEHWSLEKIIKEYINSYYNTKDSADLINYIYNQYEVYNCETDILDGKNIYYKIKLKLI